MLLRPLSLAVPSALCSRAWSRLVHLAPSPPGPGSPPHPNTGTPPLHWEGPQGLPEEKPPPPQCCSPFPRRGRPAPCEWTRPGRPGLDPRGGRRAVRLSNSPRPRAVGAFGGAFSSSHTTLLATPVCPHRGPTPLPTQTRTHAHATRVCFRTPRGHTPSPGGTRSRLPPTSSPSHPQRGSWHEAPMLPPRILAGPKPLRTARSPGSLSPSKF